ncbi:MAG: glycine cleavage system aminomethyltransferase GcvT [Rhizobiaceae bacterium]
MMSESNSKHTPLHDLHLEEGGKMVDFAGWQLPIQFPTGLMAEHNQCRERAALFDVSHMGQVELRGPDAAEKLEALVPSNISPLKPGQARYTFFTNEDGGIMDDLIVSNAGDCLFAVVNASMRDQDIAHMRNNLDGVDVHEITDCALIAVQGPAAEKVIASICQGPEELTFMQTGKFDIMGADCRVSRLGYTGEDGFEISIPQKSAVEITRAILSHEDCEPAGLGARDSLRLEAGLCLYGNDIDQTTSPIEASLVWAIQKRRREEGGFPGADKILKELAEGTGRKLVGIKPEGRAPARAGVEICAVEGEVIGTITSGGFGPTVGGPVAMGYVSKAHSEPGTKLDLIIRGKPHPAIVTSLPFVKQNYKR